MSRVDEALRRAREQQPGSDESTVVPPGAADLQADAADVASLAEEPFPIEFGERHRSRVSDSGSKAPASHPRPVAAATKPATTTAPASESQETAPGRWMERVHTALAQKIVIDRDMLPASREQYRRLAATLHQAQLATELKVLMITSAVAGEGKTLTASNLALTLSESYDRNVLLIDADLRRPTVHSVFSLESRGGLYDDLMSPQPRRVSVHQVSRRLTVLPAGTQTADPIAVLTSERFRHLIEEARETFEWVIIDTPPLALLPDAHLLTSIVDGTVLVVKADSTPHDAVKRAIDIIGRERMLGVVLNAATHAPGGMDGYEYDYRYAEADKNKRAASIR